jgi:hypothetical protein
MMMEAEHDGWSRHCSAPFFFSLKPDEDTSLHRGMAAQYADHPSRRSSIIHRRVPHFCDRHGIMMQEEVPAGGPETFSKTTDDIQHALEQNGFEQLRDIVQRFERSRERTRQAGIQRIVVDVVRRTKSSAITVEYLNEAATS